MEDPGHPCDDTEQRPVTADSIGAYPVFEDSAPRRPILPRGNGLYRAIEQTAACSRVIF